MFIYEKDGRKRPALEVICSYCDKKFPKAKRFVKDKNYCCIEHANAAKITTVEVLCSLCGKSKKIKKSVYNSSKTKVFFCDRDCQNEAQSSKSEVDYSCNYVDGSSIYRKLAFDIYPNECEICGYDDFIGVLDVHHIDSDRSNNVAENLIILCPNHHVLITRRLATLEDRKIKLVNK